MPILFSSPALLTLMVYHVATLTCTGQVSLAATGHISWRGVFVLDDIRAVEAVRWRMVLSALHGDAICCQEGSKRGL
jgi:hypothetical protein